MLSFTVQDINATVTKLIALGAELDGSIKYEIYGKVKLQCKISIPYIVVLCFLHIFVLVCRSVYNLQWAVCNSRYSHLCNMVVGDLSCLFQVAAMRCADGHVLSQFNITFVLKVKHLLANSKRKFGR